MNEEQVVKRKVSHKAAKKKPLAEGISGRTSFGWGGLDEDEGEGEEEVEGRGEGGELGGCKEEKEEEEEEDEAVAGAKLRRVQLRIICR